MALSFVLKRAMISRGLSKMCFENSIRGHLGAGNKISFKCLNTSQIQNIGTTNNCLVPIKPIGISNEEVLHTGRLRRLWHNVKWRMFDKTVQLRSSTLLYTQCVDDVDYLTFFKEFNLSDTFMSWFLVTELHVWLCQARVMAEDKEGRYMRNKILQAMWNDVDLRIGKLGNVSAQVKKEGLDHLLQHYYAAMFSYDEGLLSDDKVLAGAVWRIFFSYNCADPRHLEILVHYIRMQMNQLDKIPRADLLQGSAKINWLSLDKAKETF